MRFDFRLGIAAGAAGAVLCGTGLALASANTSTGAVPAHHVAGATYSSSSSTATGTTTSPTDTSTMSPTDTTSGSTDPTSASATASSDPTATKTHPTTKPTGTGTSTCPNGSHGSWIDPSKSGDPDHKAGDKQKGKHHGPGFGWGPWGGPHK